MATLRRLTMTGVVEAELPLDRAELTLGRGTENDVVIGEKLVSRRHAKIVRTAQGGHVLLDDGSNIGVMMGETKVSHRELREGDVFQIGLTRFQYTLASSSSAVAAPKRAGKGWAIFAIIAVLVVVGGAVATVMLVGGKPSSTEVAARGSGPAPVGGGAFVRLARDLAGKVAVLDRAEQAAIAIGGDLDGELRAVADAALAAGRTAQQLADTVAAQDGASRGRTRMWEQYRAVARTSYAVALTAEQYRALPTDDADMVARSMTELGTRLWNPDAGEVEAAAPTTMVPVPEGTGTWVSSSAETIHAEIRIDADAPASAQAREAIAGLAASGAHLDRDGAVVAMFAGISITDLAGQAIDKVKTYVPGEVTKVATNVAVNVAEAEVLDFVNGTSPKPIDPDARVKIASTPPPSVAVVIGRVNRPSDAPTKVQIDVSWSGGTGDVTVVCQVPMHGNVEATGAGSGSTRVEITLSGAPASATLEIRCGVRDASGVEVGWKELQIEPQQEPLDAGVKDAGVVADAAPVAAPDATPARPIDAALGDAWIEPYVQGFEADLLRKRPGDEVAIAIVTEDLRACLKAAVASGLAEAAAKQACARALKDGKAFGEGVDAGAAPATAGGWTGVFAGSIAARVTVKGKTRPITVAQVITLVQQGATVVLTNKEGEVVKLAIAADGVTATGKHAVEHVESTVTLTLQGDAIVLRSDFVDDDGGHGTMNGTLTRQ